MGLTVQHVQHRCAKHASSPPSSSPVPISAVPAVPAATNRSDDNRPDDRSRSHSNCHACANARASSWVTSAHASSPGAIPFSCANTSLNCSSVTRYSRKMVPSCRAGNSGCKIGYMDYTGCHQLVFWWSLPASRVSDWLQGPHRIPAVINWCFDCRITLW